jgi:hypothetical protein
MRASAIPSRIGYTISEDMATNRKRGIFKEHVYLANLKNDETIGEKCNSFLSDLPEHMERLLWSLSAGARGCKRVKREHKLN